MAVPRNAETRALSSVLIGNIPIEISEDQLKDLFSEVGQVINFKLFYDKMTGKSKGFAFCEYKEPEIAISAVRNLGGFALKGQPLQVDIAASEKCRQEMERLQGSIVDSAAEASPEVPSEKAPEEISKAVASLPAEQMFELMKQMKMCIENNPQEARNLLLQNPQLAYALLQAQVIMRIVDPEVAVQILDRGTVAVPDPDAKETVEQMPEPAVEAQPAFTTGISTATVPQPVPMPQDSISPHIMLRPGGSQNQFVDQDLRNLVDQDLRQLPPPSDRDMRAPPVMMTEKDMRLPMVDQDFRTLPAAPLPDNRPFDPRFRNVPSGDMNRGLGSIPNIGRAGNIDPRTSYPVDPRAGNASGPGRVEDPRKAGMAAALNARLAAGNPALQNLGPSMMMPGGMSGLPGLGIPEDAERAALILQVLQLTEQQIAVLPPEQRQSILVLKEQLARSQQI